MTGPAVHNRAGRAVHCALLLVLIALPVFPLHAEKPPGKGGDAQVQGGGMPDLARGKLAAASGDFAGAESNFLPLARRGYLEAQLALARLYAHQHTPQSTQKAIHWFRVAAPKAPLQAEVPLARLLLQQDRQPQLMEAQRLFMGAWDDRKDPEALAGLIELYADHPRYDTLRRMPELAASAERLDLPATNGALISWYRNTREKPGHEARLLAMCRRSLNLAPTCYVDLLRAARARNDQQDMRRMAAAAVSQFRQGLVPIATIVSIVHTLVEAPQASDDDPEASAVAISDAPETDARDLAPTGAPPATAIPGMSRSCTEEPVRVARPEPATSPATSNATPTANTGGAASGTSQPQQPPRGGNTQPGLADYVLAELIGGSTEARVEAAGAVIRFPFLAPDFDVEAALREGLKRGIPDAALYLGEMYLYGDRATLDPHKAQRFLQRAALDPDTSLAAQYYIGRLYQFGYLDEVDPRQALDHLLYAARRGYVSADSALARFYASGKGVCPNHVYAYVFARLGARNGGASIHALARQLNAVLTPQERPAAQRLLLQEETARQQLPQPEAGLAEAAPSTP